MVQIKEVGSKCLYFDNNATTPVEPAVFKALAPFLQARFGNPSSKHPLGVSAASAVAEARAQIASCLGIDDPTSIVFTSGATESINWALRSALKLSRHPTACNVVCCALEHPAGLRVCEALRDEFGCDLRLCAVNRWGILDLDHLETVLDADTAVVSLPLANGEIGSVQPLAKVVSLVRRLSPNAVIHSDASQAMGKVPVHPKDLGVDLLTIAGHKIYAPKGVGALYIRKGLHIEPLILGGGQERGLRGGTENVAFIVALAKACQLVEQSWAAVPRDTSQAAVSAAAVPAIAAAPAADAAAAVALQPAKLQAGDGLEQLPPHASHLGFVARVFIEAFWRRLEKETGIDRQELKDSVRLNGPLGSGDPSVEAQWLPGTVHLSVRGANGFEIACGLAEEEGVLVSAGVSCHQGADCSAALKAMGVDEAWGLGALRISVGRHTTIGEAVEAAERLARFLVLRKFIDHGTHASAPSCKAHYLVV